MDDSCSIRYGDVNCIKHSDQEDLLKKTILWR